MFPHKIEGPITAVIGRGRRGTFCPTAVVWVRVRVRGMVGKRKKETRAGIRSPNDYYGFCCSIVIVQYISSKCQFCSKPAN